MSRVLAVAFCALITVPAARADERPASRLLLPGTLVRVEQTDGRILTGYLDASSDDTIILRSELPGIVLTTSIPGSTVSVLRRHRPAPDLARPGGRRGERHGRRHQQFIGRPAAPFDTRIRSLEARSWLANWDEDAALDGLQVQVLPLNAQGLVVPVAGSLNVQLIARRFSNYRERDTVDVVERWSRQLHSRDFSPQGAVVNLEFDRIDPEKDLELIPIGLLNVELGVSGQRVFRASEVDVWLRPPSYIRDELQLHTGSRVFRHNSDIGRPAEFLRRGSNYQPATAR